MALPILYCVQPTPLAPPPPVSPWQSQPGALFVNDPGAMLLARRLTPGGLAWFAVAQANLIPGVIQPPIPGDDVLASQGGTWGVVLWTNPAQ